MDHERQGRRGTSSDIFFYFGKGSHPGPYVDVNASKSQKVSRQNTTHMGLRITADDETYNRLFHFITALSNTCTNDIMTCLIKIGSSVSTVGIIIEQQIEKTWMEDIMV